MKHLRHFRFLSTSVLIKNIKDSNCVIPDDCISSSTISILLIQKENAIFKMYSQQIFHLRVMFIISCENYCWREGTPGGWSESCHKLHYITLSWQYRIKWISIPDNSVGLEMALTNMYLLLIFSLFSFTFATQKNLKIFRCVIESCSGWRLNQVRQHYIRAV